MKVINAVPYLTVDDLDKELSFYQQSMNYEIVNSLKDEKGIFWVYIRNGGSDLMLSNRLVHGRRKLTWLYVEDVEDAYDQVLKSGGKPLNQPEDFGYNTKEFIINDDAGNTLVIAQRLK